MKRRTVSGVAMLMHVFVLVSYLIEMDSNFVAYDFSGMCKLQSV